MMASTTAEQSPDAVDYVVSVRELCAFTAKAGDLDLRFTPAPTSQEGIVGHKLVAARRPAGHVSELSLQGAFNGLRVRGRADGYDPNIPRLEEIKTHRGDLARVPANHRHLHLAQAETYAHLKCEQDDLAMMEVAVVYFDIQTQTETPLSSPRDANELKTLFEDRCTRFKVWASSERCHRDRRDRALAALKFPHHEFRAGQRELAEGVFRGAREGRCVLAQAPTGIGKTVGTLFPALKALAAQKLDKVFYLTAKTAGRQLALDGLKTIAAGDVLPLRVIELVARESACEHPDKACHGDSCPLARGFYDRLPAARSAAITTPFLDRAQVRRVALEHGICPYYLAQELVTWSDVVVGDYNHYFDATAMLHGMTVAHEWRVIALVDEAHNLVERGRAMYTAELHYRDLASARRHAPHPARRALNALDRCWKSLVAAQTDSYQVHDELPDGFIDRLDAVVAALGELQAERPDALDADLLQFFFAASAFGRLADSFADHTLFEIALTRAQWGKVESCLCLRNVIPATHLARRYVAAQSVTLFSATLAPQDFYRTMLGLPGSTVAIDVASPFSALQLSVRVARGISTRFSDRARSVAPITALIARQFAQAPGNYIAFFSSFDYLDQVAAEVMRCDQDIPTWVQSPRMSEGDQREFLARFEEGGRGIGFAVLGGRFAEGIDLPGSRLVGAFIATLGLPQVNPVNEEMRLRMARKFGAGYEYAYLYPGLRKVAQAAGRVIRTATDRGVVHLIDDRFAQARVRALLPRWWGRQESLDASETAS